MDLSELNEILCAQEISSFENSQSLQGQDWEKLVINEGIDERDNNGNIQERVQMGDINSAKEFLRRFDIKV